MDTQPMNSEMELDNVENQTIDTKPLLNNFETPPLRCRKKKSTVWEHFTIETVGSGPRRAICKQCKKSYVYDIDSGLAGTSHLKRHIAKGACSVVLHTLEKSQLSPYSASSEMVPDSSTLKQRYRTTSEPHFAFDPDRCRHEISRMIIMHEYPLHMIEHPGLVAFVQNLQPRFDVLSFNTVEVDCVLMYLRERQNIQKLLEGIPGRMCLSLDLWSSCQTTGYMCMTGQFIDSDGKMQRKLLNVIMEPYPDSDTAFSDSVAACLADWSMDGKLFAVSINQPLSNAACDNLKALLSVKNPLILNGQLLVGNCLARSLSCMVQDVLTSVRGIVAKVRYSVKYVKTSELHEERFNELKQKLQVPCSNSLAIDDQTQWNTTYEMLLAASELKEVFSCLDTSDPDYKNAPSMEDWKQIETLCTYSKPLFDTANLLTTRSILTINTFFHEALKIQLELERAGASEDPMISGLAKSTQENFDKYWSRCCFVLAIAVVMDPRYKMKLVEFSFSRIYGEEAASYIKIVDDGIHELFLEYVALPLPLTFEEANGMTINLEDPQGIGLSTNGLGFADFDVYIMESASQQLRSELDQYLQEPLLPRNHEFDVVAWWGLNRDKYPTLSRMAFDVLSIPVSTLPSASIFDTRRKEMDSYRCSLPPKIVEALMCTKDWLQSAAVDSELSPVKMEVPVW